LADDGRLNRDRGVGAKAFSAPPAPRRSRRR